MLLTKLLSYKFIQIPVRANIDWEGKSPSKPQALVKSFLYPYFKFDQVAEEFYIPGSKFRIDFFNINRKIAVEVSPNKVHTTFNPWMHKSRAGFLAKIKADESKRNWCERNNIRLIELYDEDIKALSKEYIEEKYGISL